MNGERLRAENQSVKDYSSLPEAREPDMIFIERAI